MKHHILCYILVIVLFSFIAPAHAKPDQRLDLFIQQFDKLKNKDLRLDHRDNPFHLYLDKQFEEGLDTNDKADLLRSQEKGECIHVYQLVIKGFLQLYPFLKPAFEDLDRGGKLESMIHFKYQGPASRCFNYMSLNILKERFNITAVPPLDMGPEIALKYESLQQRGKPKTDKDKLITIQFGLGKNAFCNDYPPSIRDLITTANKPGGMLISPQEELYLIERAQLHAILKEPEYHQHIETIKQKFTSLDQFTQIRKASKTSKLLDMEPIKGFWLPTCKMIRKDELNLDVQ